VAVTESAPSALSGRAVLIVEDDAAIGAQLVRGLQRAGCRTAVVTTGAAALEQPDPDFALVDLGLPDMDGVELCRLLHRRSDVRIVVITARHAVPARVETLDAGADDYLVKPFGLDELLARMRAVLRRSGGSDIPVTIGRVTVDVPGRRAVVDGEQVPLTGREFDILACLALEPGRVVSREEIFDRVWDEHWYGPRKVLDVHIAALRRKLGDSATITTVYGRGFRIDP
jgi:DNA-binding response OmpR family regulator